jgi:hypothetical protein
MSSIFFLHLMLKAKAFWIIFSIVTSFWAKMFFFGNFDEAQEL